MCPEDLKLLKALGKGSKEEDANEANTSDSEDGFASAIAGIFDNLDGEDSVLTCLESNSMKITLWSLGIAKLKVNSVF